MKTDVLQKLITESSFTKVQIAEKCGITRVTLDNALQGADVKISTIEAIANVLGVSAGVLFDGCDSFSTPSVEEYKKEIERLQTLLNTKITTKVIVELDVTNEEFVRLGLKDKVVQVLNKKTK